MPRDIEEIRNLAQRCFDNGSDAKTMDCGSELLAALKVVEAVMKEEDAFCKVRVIEADEDWYSSVEMAAAYNAETVATIAVSTALAAWKAGAL